MRKNLCAVLVVLALAACGRDASGPEYDYNAYVGTWNLDLAPTDGCWNNGTRMAFVVRPEDAAGASGGILNVVSTWQASPPSGPARPMSGHFDLGAGTFRLVMRWDPYQAEYRGTIDGRRLSGAFTSPKGLFSGFYSCDAEGVASK